MKILMLLLALSVQPRTVMEFQSREETKEQFIQRVAVFLQGWTRSTGNEACGLLAEGKDGWSVILQTVESQVECASNAVYAGDVPTGETIHVHPETNGTILLNLKTRRISGINTPVKRVKRHAFSEGDYAAGCGYLVDNGWLMYQCGKGTERKIGLVEIEP